MQGRVAGKRSSGKPRQRWGKYITDTFGTMAAASRVAENINHFRRDIQERRERETFETRPIVLNISVLNETDPYAIHMANILNKSSVYICH